MHCFISHFRQYFLHEGQLMSESLMGVEDDVDLDRMEKDPGSSSKFGENLSDEENNITAERVKNLVTEFLLCNHQTLSDIF